MAPLTYKPGLYKDLISELILPYNYFSQIYEQHSLWKNTNFIRSDHIPDNIKYHSLGPDNPFFSGLLESVQSPLFNSFLESIL